MALTNAANLSDYLETALLNLFKGVKVLSSPSVTAPAAPTFYAGVLTSTSSIDTGTTGGTQDGTEVSTSANVSTGYAAYARQSITFGAIAAASAVSDSSTGQQIQNTNTINFPVNGNTSTAVVCNGIGVWDASSSGNLWFYVTFGATVNVAAAANLQLAASALTIAAD